jgi:hypothetical protein
MADDDAAPVELGGNARRRVMKKMKQFTQRTRGESGEKINLLIKRFSAARQLAEQQARRVEQNNGDPKGDPNGLDQSCESKEAEREGAIVVSTGDGERELGQSVQVWGKLDKQSTTKMRCLFLANTCFFPSFVP